MQLNESSIQLKNVFFMSLCKKNYGKWFVYLLLFLDYKIKYEILAALYNVFTIAFMRHTCPNETWQTQFLRYKNANNYD